MNMVECIEINGKGDKLRVHYFSSKPWWADFHTAETRVQEFWVKNSLFYKSTALIQKENMDSLRVMASMLWLAAVIASKRGKQAGKGQQSFMKEMDQFQASAKDIMRLVDRMEDRSYGE